VLGHRAPPRWVRASRIARWPTAFQACSRTLLHHETGLTHWDKGIRQFSGGRVHADGTVVTYGTSEKIAAVKRPRSTYLTAPDVEVERLERQIDVRFLSLEERERIHDLHRDGMSMRSIAVELCRSPSTISRELARNSQEHVGYLPYGAHRLAASRRVRPKPRKLALNGPLRSYVEAGWRSAGRRSRSAVA
jgi:transposase, IS30 family